MPLSAEGPACMSTIERVLSVGSTESPDCRCGSDVLGVRSGIDGRFRYRAENFRLSRMPHRPDIRSAACPCEGAPADAPPPPTTSARRNSGTKGAYRMKIAGDTVGRRRNSVKILSSIGHLRPPRYCPCRVWHDPNTFFNTLYAFW